MSISLSSCFPSQLSQNHILSDRQSYGNDSMIGQAHDFSKDINQMENMITSMEEMSKDIRSHLLDLQTMPGATNAYNHLQQQTEHFESIVEDQIRSSLQRFSPVIMQSNLYLETAKPYSTTPEWKHQTPPSPPPPRELHPTITGGSYQERSEYEFEFCTPPNLTRETESNIQAQTNTEMCRRRLQFERDTEGKNGFQNISSFTKEDHSYTNQTPVTHELDGSHFTACLDQGLKKSSPKEKSSDASVKGEAKTQTSTTQGTAENNNSVGTELSSESGDKPKEPTILADSNQNVNLKDLVSQAAKLLDSNGADLNIDTDSMVDSMLSDIREAFNQNVEKVFKDVNTSELLTKLSQETSYSKMPFAEKKPPNITNENDVLVCDKNPEGYELSEDDDMDEVDHDYYYYCHPPPTLPFPPPASPASTSSADDSNFDSSAWKSQDVKLAWREGKGDKMLWGNNRRKKKKEEVEEEEEEEEEEEGSFSPFISGGVRPQRSSKFDRLQPRKYYSSDQDKKHHQKHKGANYDESEDTHFPLLSDMNDFHSTAENLERTSGQHSHSKGHQKHKRCVQKKSHSDKKSRGVHFSDTVHLIEVNGGDVIESDILMPQGKIDYQSRGRLGKYSSNKGPADPKPHQNPSRKWMNKPNSFYTQRQEAGLSYEPVTTHQERTTHDKYVMTPWDVSNSNSVEPSSSAWTKESWNEPSSPRTRTENWKCNSRTEDEQNGIFKSLTIESVSTENTLPPNQWLKTGNSMMHNKDELSENRTEQYQEGAHAKRHGNDPKKDNSEKNGMHDYNIAGGCGHNLWEGQKVRNFGGWQTFDQPESNLNCPGNSTESQMAFVCCILPQSICNSANRNTETYENVYISNMMLNDLKGEDLKNPHKIGQPIEPSEAKKVSYLVRELMDHLHANETFLNNDYPTDRGMAAGTESSPPGRRMSWVDAVNPVKSSSSRLAQCGSPILFCYLPPEFLPKAHQVKSLKKPSKDPRKTLENNFSTRDKVVKKSAFLHKGCQTENNINSRNLNSSCKSMDNQGAGLSWWISAPPRLKKKPSPRLQQIYSNRLPPPVPLMTVKSVGKGLRSITPERKPTIPLSPYNKKPKLGVNSSPTKRKPFVI